MRIEVDNRALKKALEQLAKQCDSPAGTMRDVAATLQNLILLNLRLGRTPWGGAFKPLAALTVNTRFRGGKRYTKKGEKTARFNRHLSGNHIPLNDTGQHIANRITYQAGDGFAVVGMLDSEHAKIGKVHQFGATIRAKNAKYLAIPVGDGSFRYKKQVTIPARPFLPIRNGKVDLPTEWEAKLTDLLKQKIKSAISQ